MYGACACDESEDEGCYVYWDTPALVPPAAAPAPSPRRPSQRSGAPSPSLGTSATGTPKPKRTTTAAALPSPTASTTSTVNARALRQRKRLKGGRRGAQEPASQPLDARTLQMVSQLAMKVNARTASMSSPAPPRARHESPSGVAGLEGKGKGRAVEEEPAIRREPLRPSPTNNVPATSTTPLRRTPARAARAAQSTLSLPKSKATAARASPATVNKAPPPTVPNPACAAPLLRPQLSKTASSTTITTGDEFDSFFDDADDTFELALSQMDESALNPTPPSSLAPPPYAAHPPPAVKNFRPAATARAPPALIVHTSRVSQGAARQAVAELAQREAEALAADLGAGAWSDDDF
ncbi:hypothetical protein JCM3770_003096 [Rhodotorula araucariae]